ncbi:MAG: hypothetical protein ACK528_00835 [Alphaproteobacteria bacterium]|jgi:hypothetical protein
MQQDKIALLRKLDRQTTKVKIMQLVTRCTQLLNVQNNMNAMQIEFCAENIMEQMWMYSLEDIQLCLDRGAIGMYGTIYNRIDPATILAWFPLYDQERQVVSTTINETEKQANNIYEMFQNPQVMQAMNDVYDKMPHKEAPAQEPQRQVNAFEQQLLSEFDALPEWVENKWFRLYKNRPFQFTEYRKERYMEEINNQNEY